MSVGMTNPPPLPEEWSDRETAWYYVTGGTRTGPVSAEYIKELLTRQQIEGSVRVWQKGMPDWKELRETELAEAASEPPPLTKGAIGNGYVWILAALPFLFALVDASVAQENRQALAWAWLTGAPYRPSHGMPWQIPFVVNGLFGLLDSQRLKKAGHGGRWLGLGALLLVPVYLFVRARRLKQRPSYAVAWMVAAIAGLIIYAAAAAS